MATAEAIASEHAHDEHGHDHPEWMAHHFETPEQQFDAGKLGIWLFLAQEVLFFTGLFVAYAVYRMNHPEVFVGAATFLNPTLGALNTIVLLASSLAVAWAVRCAQKNQQEMLLWLHIFTLACAGLFMGVKIVEYSYKFDEGLYWAGNYSPTHLVEGVGLHAQLHWAFIASALVGGALSLGGWMMYRLQSTGGAVLAGAAWAIVALYCGSSFATSKGLSGISALLVTLILTVLCMALIRFFMSCFKGDRKAWGAVAFGLGMCVVGMAAGIVIARGIQIGAGDHHADAGHAAAGHADSGHSDMAHGAAQAADAHSDDAHADHAVDGHAEEHADGAHGDGAHADEHAEAAAAPATPAISEHGVNQGNFFSIYFAMTGVHALHIFGGIAVIAWICGRIARGDFNSTYYGPVEYVGLYWHLVDLVWIYLFPLLYLIH